VRAQSAADNQPTYRRQLAVLRVLNELRGGDDMLLP